MKTNIETFDEQCSVHELWNFIEDNLEIKKYPYPMYWITERNIEACKRKNNIFLAMSGKTMIGCLIVDGNKVEILCVAPNLRKQGIGRYLLTFIEKKWSKDKRRKSIILFSEKAFKVKEFYEKLGFEVYGSSRSTWTFRKAL